MCTDFVNWKYGVEPVKDGISDFWGCNIDPDEAVEVVEEFNGCKIELEAGWIMDKGWINGWDEWFVSRG